MPASWDVSELRISDFGMRNVLEIGQPFGPSVLTIRATESLNSVFEVL